MIILNSNSTKNDLFKKPIEQTSSNSPDNSSAVSSISLADFMCDTPGMYNNIIDVYDEWRPRVIFPQYENVGASISLKFSLNRLIPEDKISLLQKCIITTNVSDLLESNVNYNMSEILKSMRIRKYINVEGQTAFLVFRSYEDTTRLHDRLYVHLINDTFQHEKTRGTYNADVDSYHNLEVPGWYMIGKTYASMNGVTGGVVSYNNSINPGEFSFYAPESVGTHVYDSVFGIPNSYVEAIWIDDDGLGNHFLNVRWRHIKHLANISHNLNATNSINIYLPNL